jgi:hypothetical protein
MDEFVQQRNLALLPFHAAKRLANLILVAQCACIIQNPFPSFDHIFEVDEYHFNTERAKHVANPFSCPILFPQKSQLCGCRRWIVLLSIACRFMEKYLNIYCFLFRSKVDDLLGMWLDKLS